MNIRSKDEFIIMGLFVNVKLFLNGQNPSINNKIIDLHTLHDEITYHVCTNEFQYVQDTGHEFIIVLNSYSQNEKNNLKLIIKKA